MSSYPFIEFTNIFNPNDFGIIDGTLSLTEADSRYLKLTGGNINGDLALTGALSCSQLNANLTSSGLSWQSIAGTSTIALKHTLNGTALLGSTTNTAFGFLTNNTERVRILNNGNFGIGTATASYKLDVNGDINTNTLLRINKTTNGQTFNSTNGTSTCVLYHFNNGNAYFGTTTSNNLVFQTQNVARMTIASTGAITGISSLTGATLIASSTLTVNGVDVGSNLAPLVNITEGVGVAQKAVVLNSDKDYSGIRHLSITGDFIASTSIASPSITCNSLSASTDITTASLTVNGAINITGNWNSSGTTIIQNTNSLVNIASIDFHAPSLIYKSIFRASTISLSDGIEIYDTQFSTNSVPNLNFRNDNNSSPIFMEMCGFLNNNRTTVTANGMPFQIRYKDGLAFTSGLNISCMNTTAGSNTNYNIVLSARNTSIPHLVVNDQNNQLHLFPQNLVELNTSYVQNVIVGEEMLVRKTLCVGTSQDIASSRLISALNSSMATSSAVYLCLGQNNTSNNQAEISFYYTGSGSSSNRLEFGFFGGSLMYLLANGRLGVGTNNPLAGIHTTVGVSTTIAVSGVYGEYGSGSYSSGNLGPITRTIGIRATDSFLTNGSYFAQSDRRVKKNIRPIELAEALDFIKNVKPVKYKLINEDDTKPLHNGYIAQELKNHIDLLNFSECNDLPKETEDDIENVMLSVDYAKVCVLLHRAILDLYDQIDKLQKKD